MGWHALGVGEGVRTMPWCPNLWTIRDQYVAVHHSVDFALPGYNQERRGNFEDHYCA